MINVNSHSNSGPDSKQGYWRKCTTCKNLIGYSTPYWICSVSTCNRLRTDLVFCDLRCFDAHVPVLNHRDAGAFERTSPSEASVAGSQLRPLPQVKPGLGEREILVVVSKVKSYIRARSGMNTSDSVMDTLSVQVRQMADQAIKKATQSGRKTVLDRDLE